MIAQVQENRAKVVLAEADVPKAIARSFREGRLHQHLRAKSEVAGNDNGNPQSL